MDTLAKIKAPLQADYAVYERLIRDTLHSDYGFISEILDYVLSSRGKGIRPLLVMLLGKIHSPSGELNDRAYMAAMLVELVHIASLIHDDVVDDAEVRHGRASVNTRWNPRISVLMGDYILARVFAAGIDGNLNDIVSSVTSGVASMTEGEFMQIDYNGGREMTREVYLEIIHKKTATLLGISSRVGALAMNAPATEVGMACRIGENLGMAFQIKDDILDYAPQEQTGKPYCADLREKKITLPLLTILEKSDPLQKKLILGKVCCADEDPSQIDHLHELVIKEGGLEAAAEVMHGYLDKARAIIGRYPESPYRDSLTMLCDFVGVRDR